MLLSEPVLLRCFLFSVIPVSAASVGLDIPETVIWVLSFFLLVGCAIASMMNYPSPVCPGSAPQTVYIKIDPKDLQQYASALNHPP